MMLTDEEIAKIKKGIEERAHRSHALGFNTDEHEFILKFINNLQATRQDLRELCRAVDNIDILDLEDSIAEKTALEIEQKYGWREP